MWSKYKTALNRACNVWSLTCPSDDVKPCYCNVYSLTHVNAHFYMCFFYCMHMYMHTAAHYFLFQLVSMARVNMLYIIVLVITPPRVIWHVYTHDARGYISTFPEGISRRGGVMSDL